MTLDVSTGDESSVPPVSGFIGLNTLRRKSVLIYSVRETRNNERLRVFPSMSFTCSGAISRWTFVARRWIGNQYPSFQLWRRNGTEQYERVYESTNDRSRFTTAGNSGLNIAEYVPPAPIPFQAGDVLGVYQPGDRGDRRQSVIHVRVPDDFGHVNFVGENDVAELNTGELFAFNDFPLVAVNTSKNQMFISGGLC